MWEEAAQVYAFPRVSSIPAQPQYIYLLSYIYYINFIFIYYPGLYQK